MKKVLALAAMAMITAAAQAVTTGWDDNTRWTQIGSGNLNSSMYFALAFETS